MTHVHVVAISGSLRDDSYNTALLRAAAQSLPEGMTLEIITLNDVPLYDPDTERALGFPPAVAELRARITAADAILIATPEYNHSIPGVLKNALDWLSRRPEAPLNGKPAAIMGAATGMGGTVRAQEHLRQILIALNGLVLNKPEVLVGHAHTKFDENNMLTDRPTEQFIRQMMENLYHWALTVSPQRELAL